MTSGFGRWSATATHHSPLEDAQGILTGALMVTIGLSILAHLGFVTGGTAGLAITRLGWAFTIKTFLAVACLSVLTALQPEYFTLGAVNPLVGAVLGGVLIGYGLLALYRHRASLGGVGILAIYLQDRLGWKAGLTQLAVDLVILVLSFAVADPVAIVYSIVGALVLNLWLAVNHRPDRYIAA